MSTLQSPEIIAAPEATNLARSRPPASVVLTSIGSEAGLRNRLAAVMPPCRRTGSEVIVVRAASTRQLQALRAAYPQVLFVPASADVCRPEMRGLGARVARGHVLLFTCDSADADMSWADLLTLSPAGHFA